MVCVGVVCVGVGVWLGFVWGVVSVKLVERSLLYSSNNILTITRTHTHTTHTHTQHTYTQQEVEQY